MGTKNCPSDFDCYANAEPDEPMFILLARDPDAPRLVREWVDGRDAAKPDDLDNAEMKREALICADAMAAWRKANWPPRTPPGGMET